MTTVIKLGGDVLEGAALADAARGVADARALHAPQGDVVVVHGGGAQVTTLSQKLGLAPQMVAGRRVTDATTIEVLQMVVAGRLNVELCAALQRQNVPAVGLHAGSGIVRASLRPPRIISGGPESPVDLGLVGDVADFDTALLSALWSAARVPVLSCLGWDGQHVLNLNADLVASQLALALRATALVAVTGVGGVRRNKDDPSSRLASLTVAEARAAIAAGVVAGGMIPKLEEAFMPLEGGVGAVHIVGPTEIALSLRSPGTVGTLLTL